MTPELWVTLIGIVLTSACALYGHIVTAKKNRVETVKEVNKKLTESLDAVKEDVAGIRAESQAKDEEMHAEILMLGQRVDDGFNLVHQEVGTLSERVEKHNNVIERTFRMEERVDGLVRRVDRMEDAK